MTQTEYDKAKEECWIAVKKELGLHYWGGPTLDIVSFAFDRAYALGKQEIKQETKQETKQEKDADTVIQGWVARDEDNTLTLFYGSNKPSKEDGDDYWSAVFGNTLEYLPQEMFPDIKWEDAEPTKVEIIIKRKKK